MRKFPLTWLNRLNDMVKTVRRRQGWGDVHAVVQAPLRPDHPPILRVEKSGTLITEPIDLRLIEQAMRTGQEGPLLAEIKQAFFRVQKAARRREKTVHPAGPPGKKFF